MRVFNLIGILAVIFWVGVVSTFLYTQHRDGPRDFFIAAGDIPLREAVLWMSVYHAGEEVGIIREDRTRLIDGWLFETQGIVTLHLLNETYTFRFESLTNLDEEAHLRTAIGTIRAFGKTLQLDGRYRHDDGDHHIDVTVNFDGESQRFSLPLADRPRLVSLAIPQMLASEDLRRGATLSQEFFDPLTLSPTPMEMTYEGTESIRHFGEDFEAHRFRQTYSSTSVTFYTEDDGTVISQFMPFQFFIGRVPPFIGQQSYREAVEAFEARRETPPAFVEHLDASFLLGLVSRMGSGNTPGLDGLEALADDLLGDGDAAAAGATRRARTFALTALPEVRRLHLESPRQRVVTQLARFTEIERGPDNPLWHEGLAPAPSAYEPRADTPAWEGPDLADLDPTVLSSALRAGLDAADLDCSTDHHSCTLFLADALAISGQPPHLIHGLHGHEDPRLWLAIYDEKGALRLEFDPLAITEDGEAGATGETAENHLQLFIADAPALDDLQALVDGAVFHTEPSE